MIMRWLLFRPAMSFVQAVSMQAKMSVINLEQEITEVTEF
jgi:hypothetical protein